MQDLIRDWREKERSLAYKKFLMNCSVLYIIGVGQAEVYEGDKKLNKGACQYEYELLCYIMTTNHPKFFNKLYRTRP
jgi:hypothetical protein